MQFSLTSSASFKASKSFYDPVSFLTQNNDYADNKDMLSMKLKKLEHVYRLKPTDDIALIRLVKD